MAAAVQLGSDLVSLCWALSSKHSQACLGVPTSLASVPFWGKEFWKFIFGVL